MKSCYGRDNELMVRNFELDSKILGARGRHYRLGCGGNRRQPGVFSGKLSAAAQFGFLRNIYRALGWNTWGPSAMNRVGLLLGGESCFNLRRRGKLKVLGRRKLKSFTGSCFAGNS